MASLNLSQDEVRILESVRQRLAQVVSSLEKFRGDVMMGQPLPPAGSIQASTTIIQQNLRTLATYITENAGILERVAVHPATNFPGRLHEGILLQLLRKKPEPAVETAIDLGRDTAAAITRGGPPITQQGADGAGATGGGGEAGWRAQREMWKWARSYCDQKIGEYATETVHEVYTAEERAMGVENVRTGLRKRLDESEDENEDEEEDDEVQVIEAPGGGAAGVAATGTGLGLEARKALAEKMARNSAVGRFEVVVNAEWEARKRMNIGVGVRRGVRM